MPFWLSLTPYRDSGCGYTWPHMDHSDLRDMGIGQGPAVRAASFDDRAPCSEVSVGFGGPIFLDFLGDQCGKLGRCALQSEKSEETVALAAILWPLTAARAPYRFMLKLV